jgi:dTMP kinase
MNRGRLITFEGGEGAGKSTQVQYLRDRLSTSGVDIVTTREPGGTAFAEQVRAFILSPDTAPHAPLAEALLFTAARADHIAAVIGPAIASGRWVLCDRFTDSTRAYQGAAGGVEQEKLRVLEDVVLGTMQPDLTFMLDIPAEVGLGRAKQRAQRAIAARRAYSGWPPPESEFADAAGTDVYESREFAFHERLRAGFLEIAREEPDRCIVVDAQQSELEIAEAIWRAVVDRFGLGGR